MLAYGSGLRIGEIANLRVEDIDSKNMRIFIREGKGNKERYTILSKQSLEMLRIYWSKYRQNKRWGRICLSEMLEGITAEAKFKLVDFLTKKGKTKDDLVIKKDLGNGKIIYDETNYLQLENQFIQEECDYSWREKIKEKIVLQ